MSLEDDMPATDVLVLPQDVCVIPVTTLDTAVQLQIGCDSDDYIVTRLQSRTPSLIIDGAAAALLESFRMPQTIVEAIIAYSQTLRLDPHLVLEMAFPLLQHLYQTKMLVSVDSIAANPTAFTFPVGAAIATFIVTAGVQVYEDVEVYQVYDPEGTYYAMKIVRQGIQADTVQALAREASILEHLHGINAPTLFGKGFYEGHSYIVMEWCSGVDALTAAQALRASSNVSLQPVLDLCVSILSAYAHLHEHNVLHADIHPGNICVDDAGAVKIIDFGLARFAQPVDGFTEPPRRGVSFYYEPEYAQAYLKGAPPVAASLQGEQYALGALLYRLITGKHYLDFRLDTEIFKQIVQDAPLPFSERGTGASPAIEQILFRALHKNPSKRFASVAEFAHYLREASRAAQICCAPSVSVSTILPMVLQATLARLGETTNQVSQANLAPPTASVNLGAAGIAYLFYRVACLQDDTHLLSIADIWAEHALRESVSDRAFASAKLSQTNSDPGLLSLYHTISGVHCVRTLISHALGDTATTRNALSAFIASSQRACANIDATLGHGSILIGSALLYEALSDLMEVFTRPLLDAGNMVFETIEAQVATDTSINDCPTMSWLGIAHGWAGVLYAMLRWCQVTRRPLSQKMLLRLEQLAGYAEPIGPGLRWPQSSGTAPQDRKTWTSWCHGTAGYVHLWTLAQAMCGDNSYLDLAEKAAWHTWVTPSQKGGSVCCGYAGQAYALLNLFKHTGDMVWYERAKVLSERAAIAITSPGLRRNSLYKGDVGIALLAADVTNPEMSCMPLFESEGWTLRR
jgi:eukaryotic-like serine/threonine-protein kinase